MVRGHKCSLSLGERERDLLWDRLTELWKHKKRQTVQPQMRLLTGNLAKPRSSRGYLHKCQQSSSAGLVLHPRREKADEAADDRLHCQGVRTSEHPSHYSLSNEEGPQRCSTIQTGLPVGPWASFCVIHPQQRHSGGHANASADSTEVPAAAGEVLPMQQGVMTDN